MSLILQDFLKTEKHREVNFLHAPCPDHWRHESVEEDHPAQHIFQCGGIDRDLRKDRFYHLPVFFPLPIR